ncbi:hypothetical protein H4219_001298 [Mycoemilia scoparia]|uniref:PIH1 N-terminal domain-containing protein n=1 Tax=Mycoemilia scoparia TaxID=417184 RepID=A0A9W8DQJ0_9FUNG|nr:hypothetical protein H4219_001298 [Mycoemilia scoparia]
MDELRGVHKKVNQEYLTELNEQLKREITSLGYEPVNIGKVADKDSEDVGHSNEKAVATATSESKPRDHQMPETKFGILTKDVQNAKEEAEELMVAKEYRVEIEPTPAFAVCTRIMNHKGIPAVTGAGNNTQNKLVCINICSHHRIPRPPPEASEEEIQRAINADPAAKWQAPMYLSPPAQSKESDISGKDRPQYWIYDAIVHPDPINRAEQDFDFRLYLTELALEHVEDKYGYVLGRDIKFLTERYVGNVRRHRLQATAVSGGSASWDSGHNSGGGGGGGGSSSKSKAHRDNTEPALLEGQASLVTNAGTNEKPPHPTGKITLNPHSSSSSSHQRALIVPITPKEDSPKTTQSSELMTSVLEPICSTTKGSKLILCAYKIPKEASLYLIPSKHNTEASFPLPLAFLLGKMFF